MGEDGLAVNKTFIQKNEKDIIIVRLECLSRVIVVQNISIISIGPGCRLYYPLLFDLRVPVRKIIIPHYILFL